MPCISRSRADMNFEEINRHRPRAATGELQHFLSDLQGNVATDTDLLLDAQNFEKNWARDVRFLHHHCHNHECSSTCIRNQEDKSKRVRLRFVLHPDAHTETYTTSGTAQSVDDGTPTSIYYFCYNPGVNQMFLRPHILGGFG